MLRNNNYNGCLPNKGIQFLRAKTLPPKFNLWREGIIDAYKRFFSEKIWTFCSLSIKPSPGGREEEGEGSEEGVTQFLLIFQEKKAWYSG